MNDRLIKCGACLCGIIGAVLISLKYGVGFVFFTESSALWMVHAHKHDNDELFYMNLAFFIINVIGMYNWLS